MSDFPPVDPEKLKAWLAVLMYLLLIGERLRRWFTVVPPPQR